MPVWRVGLIAFAVIAATPAVHAGPICYVDAAAAPGGNGGSWATAWQHVQQALAQAQPSSSGILEVRVAQGVYTPAGFGQPTTRTATFMLVSGVSVRGGFRGAAAPPGASPDERDVALYETVLSGDLLGNDVGGAGTGENCFHVVTANAISPGTVFEGFTVRSGLANGSSLNNRGGGMTASGSLMIGSCRFVANVASSRGGAVYFNGGAPTIVNSQFSGNFAGEGGALNCLGPGTPTLTGCTFSDNTAGLRGGALQNVGGAAAQVTDCTFSNNQALTGGGAVANVAGSHAALTSCTFTGNHAPEGGAVFNWTSNATLLRCTFEQNSGNLGGVVNNLACAPVFTGCTFADNIATFRGGAMHNEQSDPEVLDCAFIGNAAAEGGALSSNTSSDPLLAGCAFLSNTASGRGGAILFRNGGAPVVTECQLSGNVAGTEGGAISVVLSAVPSIDGSLMCENVPGNIQGPWINAGDNVLAATCPPTCMGDISGDGTVDVVDMLAVIAQWGPCTATCLGDLDGDGVVGITDYLAVLEAWGPCQPDNRPPVCVTQPGSFVVTAGDLFSTTLEATDPDDDLITVRVVGLPPGATYEVEAGDGLTTVTFEWTPTAADKTGAPYEVTFIFTDPRGESDSCTVTIDVNLPPECDAGGGATGTLSNESTSADGAVVMLNGSATDADDDDAGLLFHWDIANMAVVLDDPDSASPSGTFPIGSTMATLTVADGRGGVSVCGVIVEVADTTPPEVTCTTSTGSLWPANHKMVRVTLVVVATDNCAEPGFVVPIVVTVRSDEPDNAAGNGDGNTTGDVDGQDGFSAPVNVTGIFKFDAAHGEHGAWVGTIQLRSERAGMADGRTYTIDVAATDGALNLAQTSCAVVVPHDRRNAN